jgi:hypothetical protein
MGISVLVMRIVASMSGIKIGEAMAEIKRSTPLSVDS